MKTNPAIKPQGIRDRAFEFAVRGAQRCALP